MMRSELIKLNRILGMLGSAHEGERAAAALAADKLVRKLGTNWWNLLCEDAAPRARVPSGASSVIVTRHDLGVDHARAAESHMRQLRAENERLRKEVTQLRARLSNLATQERRSRTVDFDSLRSGALEVRG